MKSAGILLILFLVAVLPLLALAQEDLTETFTSSDGSLSFNHPAAWFVEGFGSIAVVTNNEEFSNAGDFETVPSGTVFGFISAGPLADIGPDIDTSGDISAMGIAQQLLDDPDSPELTEGPTALDFGSDAVLMVGSAEGNDLLVIIIVLDEETGIFFVGGSALGEIGNYRDTLIAIAASVTYSPPVPGAGSVAADEGPAASAGTGAVVWQQQRPNTFDDTGFGSLGSVAIAPDSTIYIADGFNGVRVLDADGNVTATITNNSITNIDDMALAADGTLWLTDGFDHTIYNLGTDGNLIASFGEPGSGPGQFGDYSPDELEIGPDGNLYLFDSQAVSDTETTGRIQVFDTQGNFIREFPTDPNGEGRLTSFIKMAVAPDGNLYAADFFSGITIFDPQGTIVTNEFATDALQFNSVQAIDFGADGSVYFATNEGLFVVDSAGTLIAQFGMRQPFPESGDAPPLAPGEFSSVSGLAVADNGDAIIADTNFLHSQIIRISVTDAAVTPGTGASQEQPAQTQEAPSPTGANSGTGADTTAASGNSLADAIQSGDAGAAPVVGADGLIHQWASAVTATSQYSDTSWNAMQASGPPDTNACGDIPTAWASASPGTDDIVTLLYTQAVIPTQINIHQTYNPGAIVRVAVVPADGSLPVDIPNSADPPGNTPCPGVFTLNVNTVTFPVNGVVIYLDQAIVNQWNEIDAVELVGTAP